MSRLLVKLALIPSTMFYLGFMVVHVCHACSRVSEQAIRVLNTFTLPRIPLIRDLLSRYREFASFMIHSRRYAMECIELQIFFGIFIVYTCIYSGRCKYFILRYLLLKIDIRVNARRGLSLSKFRLKYRGRLGDLFHFSAISNAMFREESIRWNLIV